MNSAIGKLYPSTKFCFILLVIIVSIFTPGHWFQYAMFPMFAVLSLFSRTFVKYLKAYLSSILLIVVLIFAVQVFIVHYDDTVPVWAFIGFSQTGLDASLGITSKIAAICAAIMWFFQVTDTKDMVYAMERANFPKKMTFVIISTIQMVPQMSALSTTIMDAQKSRGIETEGGLMVRMKAFVPMLGPLVLSLIQQTEERALALQSRAFLSKAHKTSLYQLDKRPVDMVIQIVCLVLFIGYVVWMVIK